MRHYSLSVLWIEAIFAISLLSGCQSETSSPEPEQAAAVETLPDGPLFKLFTSEDADMKIQISLRSLVQKAGLSDSLLLPMAHDSLVIADSLIARLPDEVQAFLDGFSPVDGWSESLRPQQDFDLLIYSNDSELGEAYLTSLFTDGAVDLKMFNYKAFNSMYTFPDDLAMIQLPRNVGTFRYKVHGDSLINATIQLVDKEQNALLTLRQLSDQFSDYDYDSDDYAE